MSRPKHERRRILVIRKAMQSRIILQTTLFPVVTLGVLGVVLSELCHRLRLEAEAADTVLPQLSTLFFTVLGFMTALGFFFVYVALRFSHRVAGPTHRLVQSLQRIQQGDLDFRVRLRKGDFLEEIADELNKTLDVLQQRPGPEQTAAPGQPEPAEAAEPAASAAS